MISNPARSAIGASTQRFSVMTLSPFFALAAMVALLPGVVVWLGVGLLLIAGLRHLGPDPLSEPALGRPTDRRTGSPTTLT
jgi:hypothetical protein